jgi:DNA modification methylase
MFTAINNDTVEELPNFEDNSLDLICTSIPFGTQYEYTESFNDFGHNPDNDHFWEQMDYLIPQLLRVLKPGRICAIHVKDRIRFGNVTGYGVPTIEPFSDDCSYAFRKHGWLQLCRITVVNDVVRENNQTYRLTYSEMVKDGTKMGSGTPEYWLIFRKLQTDTTKAYADVPVVKSKADSPLYHWQINASELWRSSGDRLAKPEEVADAVKYLDPEQMIGMETNQVYSWYREYSRTNHYDYHEHLELASSLAAKNRLPKTFSLFAPAVPDTHKETVMSVHDYSRMNVLNARQMARRQESHICPLPLDLIERIIDRFSMPGELVYDPFGGIGSVPYQALKMGRRGLMTELNSSYYEAAIRYCSDMEIQVSSPTLFDLMNMEAA